MRGWEWRLGMVEGAVMLGAEGLSFGSTSGLGAATVRRAPGRSAGSGGRLRPAGMLPGRGGDRTTALGDGPRRTAGAPTKLSPLLGCIAALAMPCPQPGMGMVVAGATSSIDRTTGMVCTPGTAVVLALGSAGRRRRRCHPQSGWCAG
jgi:hypothetical protein